ncbi:MAG: hypothetical protein K8I27_01825 [Planctomycetes bacterium]|nr:hypothetical protein [Planctomycetota bacterium]
MEHQPVIEALDEFVRARDTGVGTTVPDRRGKVDAAWWAEVRRVVSRAIPDDRAGALIFTDSQRRLIDFGLVDHPSIRSAAAHPGAHRIEGIQLFHESLDAVLDDVLRRDAVKEHRAELDALQQDIALWPQTHLAHIRYRDGKVNELLGDSPRCTHALKLFAEIDEKLEQLKQLEAKGRLSGALTESERGTLATLKRFIQARREQLSGILAPVTPKTAIVQTELASAAMAASEAAEASVAHLIELQDKRRGLEQRVIEQESAARRVTRDEIEKALTRELDSVASLLRLAARYARKTECAVPLDEDTIHVDANQAADAADHLLHYDPHLIDNPLAARFGPPDLLLAPGVGHGVFDASRNRWILPQRCPTSAIAGLAHAAILYRMEVDSRECGNRLLNSYRESIPGDHGARSNLKLRTALIADYIEWMTKETIGAEALPRECREWFESNIAPDKTQPWLPPEYRHKTARQLAQIRSELRAQADSADRLYRLGAISWLLAKGDPAEIVNAGDCFERAVNLSPDHTPSVYSAAAVNMHLQRYQQAIDGFRRFTELHPAGWWARKAVELCAGCR